MLTDLDRMCYQKRRFDSEEEALKAADEAFTVLRLRAYQCPNCNQWHLTKNGVKSKDEI